MKNDERQQVIDHLCREQQRRRGWDDPLTSQVHLGGGEFFLGHESGYAVCGHPGRWSVCYAHTGQEIRNTAHDALETAMDAVERGEFNRS